MIIQVSFTVTCILASISFTEDVKVLTLKHGHMTTARRSSPVPQLKCMGGTARCSFVPQVVQCYNRGSDGYDIQWECKTDMDNAYRFGTVEVTCEGYDYPDDPNILKGSCGLEYTIDLTEEGLHRKQHNQHDYYGNQHGGYQNYDHDYHDRSGYQNSYQVKTKASSIIGDLILLCIVGGIIYALYKTCIANNTAYTEADSTYRNRHNNDQPPPYNERPPPYGFRSDYMSDNGPSCNTGTPTSGSTGGGFWSGAMTGGILGYMFGNRNSNYYGSRTYASPHSSWFGSRSYGSRSYSSTPSYSFGSGGSSWSSGSSSTGTRTASGFGGTKRR
ncbi:hypothetical protein KUTeg_015948 [Tegillarca granosa]|uniref:Store-operated calcium entry-associated regulatory factor n=1 Tax=Tegillarca granosa TaxID=220873 RepID=A0ABQ9EJF5_TEGGR|nr:hypothetical protein KUTeg_015948 [Tegillarca granosa]